MLADIRRRFMSKEAIFSPDCPAPDEDNGFAVRPDTDIRANCPVLLPLRSDGTGAKIADRNIEKMRIRQGGFETIQQGLVRSVGEKGEVGVLFVPRIQR
ncbi:MAG: hypothetical protein KBH73_08955 [Syntrophobacterales bacterium]|nr:hypothetical protein [Syntrophobacterales bacterium]